MLSLGVFRIVRLRTRKRNRIEPDANREAKSAVWGNEKKSPEIR